MNTLNSYRWLTWQGKKYSIRISLRDFLIFFLLMTFILSASLLSLSLGSIDYSLQEVYSVLTGVKQDASSLLIYQIRLPRGLTGLVTGFSLGLSGALIQAITKNKLASPDILGINEGATLFISLSLLYGAFGSFGAWWVGSLGAICAFIILLAISGGVSKSAYNLVIIGVGFSGLISSMVELFLSYIDLSHSSSIYSWSIGNLVGVDFESLKVTSLIILFSLLGLSILKNQFRTLLFKEDIAKSLGSNHRFTGYIIIGFSSLFAGISVGISGPIGLIALSSPIIVSKILKNSRSLPLILCGCMGSFLVVSADLAGRVWLEGIQMPVGVLTNMLGGPFLLWVLLKKG